MSGYIRRESVLRADILAEQRGFDVMISYEKHKKHENNRKISR